ncbi:ABC transporter substrate-binding protein [Vibrio xuii]|nr:ABC transporter substrate-binding protein [Vibrio xuii]
MLFISLFFSTVSAAYHPPTKVVVYGDSSYPPYSYLSNGQPAGIYVDILQAVFSAMPKYQVQIQLVPWKRGLKMLEVGEGFALFPPYLYPDQRLYISPYSKPIIKEEVAVFCSSETVTSRELTSWPQSYFGLTIGINESFSLGGKEFWKAVKKGHIQIKEAQGNRDNILNLYNDRVDCYINDRISILWEIKQLIKEGSLPTDWKVIESATVSSEQGYLGFTNVSPERYPYKEDFVAQFNASLETLKQDGTLESILNRYDISD